MQSFWKAIAAGIMIVIGCTVYIASGNVIIGGLMFSVALCSICNMGFSLYTGKICLVKSTSDIKDLLICIAGNLVGCLAAGALIHFALPDIASAAADICSGKLEKNPLQVIVLGIFCGILMAVAVKTYRKFEGVGKYTGIFTCIPAFVICGFEHSIADMGYFAIALSTPVLDTALFILWAVIGNTIGGLILSRE